jgi:hypothetical protein
VDEEKQKEHYWALTMQPMQYGDPSWHTVADNKNRLRDITASSLGILSAACAAVLIVVWSILGLAKVIYIFFREAARGIRDGSIGKPTDSHAS